jgi:hydroxyethylthiazole kinase-like uncharacterized protein yjeF
MSDSLIRIMRSCRAHKSTCGRLAIIAGSNIYTGAAVLATQAALRCGVGMVFVFSVRSVVSVIQNSCPEAIAISLSDSAYLSHHDWPQLLDLIRHHRIGGLVIGPGLGRHSDTQSLVNLTLFEEWEFGNPLPCVIDADALHAIRYQDLSQLTHITGILTPHHGEPHHGKPHAATETHPHVMVLKGPNTLVAQQQQSFTNKTGNPGMAVAGMGDVLSGCIGALMLQGLSPFESACIGVYCHGKAGDLAFNVNHIGLTPSDVIGYLPEAVSDFVEISD